MSVFETLPAFHYPTSEGDWAPVPSWVDFYLSLGRFLSRQPVDNSRIVLGLSLPLRDFAAPLVASGCVISTLNAVVWSTIHEYFQELCNLPHPTSVMVLRKNKEGKPRQFQGVIQGAESIQVTMPGGIKKEVKMLRIQISRATMNNNNAASRTFLIDENRADTIRILDSDETITDAELPATPKGRAVTTVSEFARIAFFTQSHYVARSQLSCFMVGNLNHLRREVHEAPFGIRSSDGKLHTGFLGQILRVRRFTTALRRYYSDAFSAESLRTPKFIKEKHPHLLILDGARAFLEWEKDFPKSHVVVLLAETERRFITASEVLNERYERRSTDEDPPPGFPTPPDGVELSFFRERVN